MQPMASPRAAELTAKLQASASANREWWASHVKKAEPGKPLPWDERLGLTLEEYDELQRVFRETRLTKMGEAELEFVKSDDGRIALHGGASLPELDGIVIDTKNDFVDTPFGRAAARSLITANDEQRATGPWNGIQWRSESINATSGTGTIVKLALGRLTRDGRAILYYDGRDITLDGTGRQASRIIVFAFAE